MGKITEVELKVKVSKDEFLDFMNTNKYFKFSNSICIKEDTYYKNKNVDNGSFIRLRCTTTEMLLLKDSLQVLYGFEPHDTKEGKNQLGLVIWERLISGVYLNECVALLGVVHNDYITLKTKNMVNDIETNEEQEAKISCSDPKEFMNTLIASSEMDKWFTKTKYAAKFVADSEMTKKESAGINLEFVHIEGIDGVFAEIEYVDPTGIAEQDLPEIMSWLKTIILEIGFNDNKIEPRSWKEMLGII